MIIIVSMFHQSRSIGITVDRKRRWLYWGIVLWQTMSRYLSGGVSAIPKLHLDHNNQPFLLISPTILESKVGY